MALGNANTSAQSRGKNKSILVKRRKEVVIAKNYNTVTCSDRESSGSASCRISSGSVTNTYFHNGSSSIPDVGDIVYPRMRADSKNVLLAGHYKIGPYARGSYKNMEIGSNGVVSAVDDC